MGSFVNPGRSICYLWLQAGLRGVSTNLRPRQSRGKLKIRGDGKYGGDRRQHFELGAITAKCDDWLGGSGRFLSRSGVHANTGVCTVSEGLANGGVRSGFAVLRGGGQRI